MKNKINLPAILTFYVIAVSLRYLTNKTDLLQNVPNEFLKILLQGIGPAVGAMVAFSVFKIRPILSLKGNYSRILTPFLLYWGLPMLLISSAEFLIKGTTVSLVSVPAILLYCLLEEIGWRGFLQQELKGMHGFVKVFSIAVLWFIWHLDFELTTSNLLFFAVLLLGSWGIGKVADSTQSLIAVSGFHALNNFFPEVSGVKSGILMVLVLVWVSGLILRKRQMSKMAEQTV